MATDAAVRPTQVAEPTKPFDTSKGRDELNLIDLPLTMPRNAARQLGKNGERTYKFITPEVWDHDLQQFVVRTVEIIPSPDLGFPSSFDNRVLLACTSLAKWKGDLQIREVPFSARLLIDILGLSPNGQSYTRVRESMERWQSTDYRITYPWFDKKKKKRRALHRFNLFDNIIWDAQDRDEESVFVLNDVLFQSLSNHYVRVVDLDQHGRFESHFAGEAYRLLGKLFYQRTSQEIPLEEFAFHIGVTGNYGDNGQLKRKLDPAIKELEDEGVIVPVPKSERYRKISRGKWAIRFEKPQQAKLKAPSPTKQTELFDQPIAEELVGRGVNPEIAKGLAEKYDEELIANKIELVEWMEAKDPGKVKKLPACLVAAITQDWQDKDFKSKAELEAEAQAVAEAQAKRRRKQDAQAARKAQEDARRSEEAQAKQQVIDGYLASLRAEENALLIEDALAYDDGRLQMARLYHEGRETGPMHEGAYQGAIKAVVEDRLGITPIVKLSPRKR